MTTPHSALPELEYRDDVLHFCGHPVPQLAAASGTPAFFFSEARLMENVASLRRAFSLPKPWKLQIAYSLKTACEPKLLELLFRAGCGAEAACAHELELALRAGCRPQDIVLDGPASTPELLRRAETLGLRYVKIDSLDQLRLAREAAREKLGVCLRLQAPAALAQLRPLAYLESRFGIAPAETEPALEILAGAPALELKALAVHLGSQITSVRRYLRGLAALGPGLRSVRKKLAASVEINLGGGFPSPSLQSGPGAFWPGGRTPLASGRVPPWHHFGRAIGRALPAGTANVLVLEPGRALVGNAAVMICRVAAKKDGWLITDASRNFVPESLLFASRHFLPVCRSHDRKWRRANIAGCTLHGGDVLALGCKLPPCKAGDLLAMMDAGAYTLSRAARFSTLLPAVYCLRRDGSMEMWRRKESVEDVFSSQPR